MVMNGVQTTMFLSALASIFCSATLLLTFFISRQWHREKYDRKHLLFVMSLLTMLFALSMSFLNTGKSTEFCYFQASCIHIFGVGSVIYAAAVSVDTYYYIIGFSKQYENESVNDNIVTGATTIEGGAGSIAKAMAEGDERTMSTATITGLSKENLDYYNRDTEVSMSSVNDLGMGSPSGLSFALAPGMTVFDIDYTRNSVAGKAETDPSSSAESNNNSGRTQGGCCSSLRDVAERLPRKYIIFHSCVTLFMAISLLALDLAPSSYPITYVEPGFVCYFNSTVLIPIFGLLPIILSILAILLANYFMIRNVITFYSAAIRGTGFTDRDSNSGDYNTEQQTSSNEVWGMLQCIFCSCCHNIMTLYNIMCRLDNDGGKEFRRIIIYPLYYLTISVVFILTVLVKRSVTSSHSSIIDIQICLALMVGVGNSIIWVFSDNAVMRQWRFFLHSKFVLCHSFSESVATRESTTSGAANRRGNGDGSKTGANGAVANPMAALATNA